MRRVMPARNGYRSNLSDPIQHCGRPLSRKQHWLLLRQAMDEASPEVEQIQRMERHFFAANPGRNFWVRGVLSTFEWYFFGQGLGCLISQRGAGTVDIPRELLERWMLWRKAACRAGIDSDHAAAELLELRRDVITSFDYIMGWLVREELLI